jgi:NosR/NirI family transcriptional regulator, nitrous oxide reductase regulator
LTPLPRQSNLRSSATRWGLTPRPAALLLAAVVVALLAVSAQAVTVPQLPGHPKPPIETPQPRFFFSDYLDVGMLVVALGLASYLAIRARSRRGLWWLGLGSLLYFGFWRAGCVCSIGSIQNVALSLFGSGYALPLVVTLFFILPLAVALFFGRTFCAGVCPIGAIQDLVVVRPLKVPGFVDHALGLLAYVYLGAAVLFAATGSAFIICRYDPFVSFFRLVPLVHPTDAMNAVAGSSWMLVVGGGFLVAGLFIGRPYCRWLCPYGAILRVLGPLAWRKVRITPDKCVRCNLCQDACPFGAIQPPTPADAPPASGAERLRTVGLVFVAAALVGALGWLGSSLAGPFSRMDYSVQLAEQARLEDAGDETPSKLGDALKAGTLSREEIYADAQRARRNFATGGGWLGGWVGLVLGLKLVSLSVRRKRADYEINPSTCVACGRCFASCPRNKRPAKAAAPGGDSA